MWHRIDEIRVRDDGRCDANHWPVKRRHEDFRVRVEGVAELEDGGYVA